MVSLHKGFGRALLIGCVLLLAWAAQAQGDIEYSGYLDGDIPEKIYEVTLAVGDSLLVTAEPLDGDLDTVLALFDPAGSLVAENDDRNRDTLGSAVGYTASEGGIYTVRISRYERSETSGRYTLLIQIGDASVLESLDSLSRIQLSGAAQVRDTEHFRIHYTTEGEDAATADFIEALALSVEEIWRIQIDQMGWTPPPPDGVRGGDARYDVYVANLLGIGESALGYTAPEDRLGDHPLTPQVEDAATTSYIVIENDFIERFYFNTTNPTSLMRTTMTHEFHHAIQFGYQPDDMLWYYEATATWMETASLIKDEDATGYVESVYKYPEICFGAETDTANGLLVYGYWLFIQALVDAHGIDAVQTLWERLAEHRGFAALEQTLAKYDSDVPTMLARYHVQNLVRQYALALKFNTTVWLEDTIDAVGRWRPLGDGVQELAANYFALDLPPDTYYAGLVNDDGQLDLWAVGVRGDEADSIWLGRGGSFDTGAYDYVYLMVFNTAYDNNVSRCAYADYSIDVSSSKEALAPVSHIWDATYFDLPG